MTTHITPTNNPPDSYVEVTSQLDTRSSLEAEAKSKGMELIALREELGMARQRLIEANNAAGGYSGREQDKELYLRAEKEAHQAQAEVDALEAEIGQSDVELNALQQAIDGTRIAVTVEAVVGIQSKIRAHETGLQAMRSKHRDITTRLNATPAPDPVTQLRIEQENLLAALALGEPAEAELKWVNAAIEQAQPIRAKAEEAEHTDRQALAGLGRRIAEAEAELGRLRDLERQMIGHLIVQRMREVAGHYQTAAASVADWLVQLRALESIRYRIAPGVPSGMNLEMWNLYLPAPEGQPVIHYRSLVAELNKAEQAIADKLKLAGIVIQ